MNKLKLIIIFSLILNVGIFVSSIYGMYHPSLNFAADFSAYYQVAYRLIHNPSQIYNWGTLAGDYPIVNSMGYKYMPSFLILILPFFSSTVPRSLNRV